MDRLEQPARAVFYGTPPPGYAELNGADARRAAAVEDRADRDFFCRHEWRDALDREVKVVRCGLELPGDLSSNALLDMVRLRRAGLLGSLRGGRATDLARPLDPATASRVRQSCPALHELLARIEALLAGSELFVRAVKLDRARASSTEPTDEVHREHLHLDAALSSLDDYAEPIYQFYLNVGREPRQFRVLPVSLPEMVAALIEHGCLPADDARSVPAGQILATYQTHFASAVEVIPVPNRYLAVFDGRTFAHDAGKADMAALLDGRFEASVEDDFVLALDTVTTGHHVGLYDPTKPFLDDLAPA